jgi:mono/diheme cytochrome c family protein
MMNRVQRAAVGLSALGLLAVLPLTVMADAAAGKAVYDGIGACAGCHGSDGKGDGAAAAALDPKPRNFAEATFAYDTDGDGATGTDVDLFNVIKNGSAVYGGAPTMPGRADIPDADIQAMVEYIRSLAM